MKLTPLKEYGQYGKRGLSMGELLGFATLFVVLILLTTFTSDIVNDIRDDQTENSIAYNVATNGLTGQSNFSARFGTLGTIAIVGGVIAILLASFAVGGRR